MPSLEEQHKQRLETCKEFFSTLKDLIARSNEPTFQNEAIIDPIVSYLHDCWSAIRTEAARQLTKSAQILPNNINNILYQRFSNELLPAENTLSWQEIHGNILGMASLSACIGAEHYDDIRRHCLHYIGYVSIPVREAAGDCLTTYFLISSDKVLCIKRLLQAIVEMSDSQDSNSEAVTLRLDGCLNSLGHILHAYLTQLTQPNKTHIQPSLPYEEICRTMCRSFFHAASSVRQRAGHVVNTLLTYSYTHQVTLFDYLVKHVLLNTLSQNIVEASKEILSSEREEGYWGWEGQEVSLIVFEEIVRTVLEHSLSSPHTLSSLSPVVIDSITSVIGVLYRQLEHFVCHEQFEIRRVGLQALPSVCRAVLLFSHTHTHAHIQTHIHTHTLTHTAEAGSIPTHTDTHVLTRLLPYPSLEKKG
ncbi:hypothetical protein EON65_56640, partial [archaeon]